MKKVLTLLIVPMVAMTAFFGLATPVVEAQFQGQNPYKDVQDGGSTEQLDVIGSGTSTQDGFVNVIKGAINWILGILALIALIILLWGGFQMVTAAGNEEQYKKWFTILKQAAIGLILIGIAWFVISIIFWLVNLTTTPAATGGAGTGG